MEQRNSNKSLREMYFNHPNTQSSFTSDDPAREQGRQSSSKDSAYRKFNADEITYFESIFNHHRKPKETSSIASAPTLNTHEEELEQPTPTSQSNLSSSIDFSKPSPKQETNVIEERVELPVIQGRTLGQIFEAAVAKEVAKRHAVEEDQVIDFDPGSAEELEYLNKLVKDHPVQSDPTTPHSIGDIFDEIVDNEQNNTKNYCSETFDANVQNLFDEDPEEELKEIPKQIHLPEENFFLEDEPSIKKRKKEKLGAFNFIDVLLLILIFIFLGILAYLIMARF